MSVFPSPWPGVVWPERAELGQRMLTRTSKKVRMSFQAVAICGAPSSESTAKRDLVRYYYFGLDVVAVVVAFERP